MIFFGTISNVSNTDTWELINCNITYSLMFNQLTINNANNLSLSFGSGDSLKITCSNCKIFGENMEHLLINATNLHCERIISPS